ncbi:MAG: molybdopterin cofactor-binding domain-containing protein, partial [Anaerolineae bacterium]
HVELRHGATSVVLMDHEGGSTDDIDKSFTVDDFAGQDASGEWTLFVSDNAGQDTGTIDSFAVSVTAGSEPIPPMAAGTSYENTSAVAIPDNDPTGASLSVDVPAGLTVSNVSVDVDGVYTNNVPSGAFRGFGAPQGILAGESQMNKLAEALGMDPVSLRLKNLLREGSLSTMGTPLPGGVSLVEVTRACARAAGWEEKGQVWRKPDAGAMPSPSSAWTGGVPCRSESLRRGVGLAVAFKNVGFSFGYQENCWAKVELRGRSTIERALVYIGSAEVGQGAHTVVCQMAAEACGVEVERVVLVPSDTATSPGSSGSASASRTTFMAGAAVRGAAERAMERWQAEERPAVGEFTYLAPRTTHLDPETGHGVPNLAYGYVAEVVTVEVDVETGQLAVLQVVCADDVGKAINPQQVEGQIEGAVAQAVGWATCEHYVADEGEVRTQGLSTYLIPTVHDVPLKVVPVIVERPDPRAPWGVRGMGEMPFIPLAPALVAAVHDATGAWFDELPLTPERVLDGLARYGVQQEPQRPKRGTGNA